MDNAVKVVNVGLDSTFSFLFYLFYFGFYFYYFGLRQRSVM